MTTTFDAADRPMSTGFAADLDGRLTAIPARGGAPAKALGYDALGRLVSATVGGVTRTYAYDPLDRLVTVSEGGNAVVRFRYVGVTSSVAQLLDGNGTVTRGIATDLAGSALADWAPGPTGWRRYVTNGHGDLVATAAANGTISASLRLDPWGVPLRAVPAGYPASGFQGSWTDRATTLVYARARWYDPVLATFTSEDPYPGDPADPSSRHRYAYGGGDPVDNYDPDGLACRGPCGKLEDSWSREAINRLNADGGYRLSWCTLNLCQLVRVTDAELKWRRAHTPTPAQKVVYRGRVSDMEAEIAKRYAVPYGTAGPAKPFRFIPSGASYRVLPGSGMVQVWNWPKGRYPNPPLLDAEATTWGRYVYTDYSTPLSSKSPSLHAHEYIHLLQTEAFGASFRWMYQDEIFPKFHGWKLNNRYEAIAYLWSLYLHGCKDGARLWTIWRSVWTSTTVHYL